MYESYMTLWSLIISFTIIFCTIFFYVPNWIFLTACSLITCTSLIGTFYNTVPQILLYDENENEKLKTQLFVDLFGHIIPFIIIIVSMPYLIKNTYPVRYHFLWSLLFIILFITIYNVVNDAKHIYKKDITIISVLMTLLYITSYLCFFHYSLNL
jgi:hypothetical protein